MDPVPCEHVRSGLAKRRVAGVGTGTVWPFSREEARP
jgi:hypothetical protein